MGDGVEIRRPDLTGTVERQRITFDRPRPRPGLGSGGESLERALAEPAKKGQQRAQDV